MADKQINELPSGGALQDADLLVLQRSGTAMNILGSQLAKASDITTLQTNVADRVDKTVSATTSIRDFLADSNNGIGAYILNVQNATDNPRGTGNVASAIMYKHAINGGYSEIFVFAQGRMWVSANTVTSNPPETITWTEFVSQNATVNYVDLGTISATAQKVAMTNAFNTLSITGKVCVGTFVYNGVWMFMAYKYSGGEYGMMMAIKYNASANDRLILNRNSGTDTITSINGTVI